MFLDIDERDFQAALLMRGIAPGEQDGADDRQAGRHSPEAVMFRSCIGNRPGDETVGCVNVSHFRGLIDYGVSDTPKLKMEEVMLKGGLLWMMGVPVIVIIVLLVMGVI